MKDMSRALRRHHAVRVKRARRFYFGIDNSTDARVIGMLLHTPTPCSCWMCGNPRRYGEADLTDLLYLTKLDEEE